MRMMYQDVVDLLVEKASMIEKDYSDTDTDEAYESGIAYGGTLLARVICRKMGITFKELELG